MEREWFKLEENAASLSLFKSLMAPYGLAVHCGIISCNSTTVCCGYAVAMLWLCSDYALTMLCD